MRQTILDLINQRLFTDAEVLALGADAVPDLIALYAAPSNDTTGAYQQTIIHMLGLLDTDQGVEFLKAIYEGVPNKDETLAMASLSALARTDHDAALTVVLPLLVTGSKRTRKNVLIGLRNTQRDDVLATIKRSAQSDPDPSLRQYAERITAEVEERQHKE